MMRTRLTQPNRMLAGLAILLLTVLASPLGAQSVPAHRAFAYNASEEVTLQGTVSSVLLKPSSGMIVGSHLLITTSSGPVDVSLGRFALWGKGAVSVAAGQQIEVTGVMKTIGNQQVFLGRTVKIGDQVYPIRNEHGVPISPQARGRVSGMAQKGDGQ